ncbi:hypothetical protein JFU50_08225 [Peribacillus sp. TH14]|nr:hypothetical protein [Peribacillus sp. TH14]
MQLKQNTQASKKGMLDKKGVEEVENLHSKTRDLLNSCSRQGLTVSFLYVSYRWAI